MKTRDEMFMEFFESQGVKFVDATPKKREKKQETDDIHAIRSAKTKEAFITYMLSHPNQRFWQSVRNFAEVGFVLVTDELDGGRIFDTFQREEL